MHLYLIRKGLISILLIGLICVPGLSLGISSLTLQITDLAALINARVEAGSVDEQSRAEFLLALDKLEQALHRDENISESKAFASTNHTELTLLLTMTRQVLDEKNTISLNQRDMLLQQALLIIKKNKELDFTGEDYIRSYHLFAKTISAEETYRLLSENAHIKLPLKAFNSWWHKTVQTVTVKRVQPLGRGQYKVWLLYELVGGKKQCSVDWLQLVRHDAGWLIDDFYWSQTAVEVCESL